MVSIKKWFDDTDWALPLFGLQLLVFSFVCIILLSMNPFLLLIYMIVIPFALVLLVPKAHNFSSSPSMAARYAVFYSLLWLPSLCACAGLFIVWLCVYIVNVWLAGWVGEYYQKDPASRDHE